MIGFNYFLIEVVKFDLVSIINEFKVMKWMLNDIIIKKVSYVFDVFYIKLK